VKYSRSVLGIWVLALSQAWASPLVIDDEQLFTTLTEGVGAFADAKQAITGATLTKASKKAPASVAVELPQNLPKAADYETQAKSVFLMGSVYKCGKCEHWHLGGSATAWCLTADGLMVTNHHVFEKATGESWGVCGLDGKVYRITEILATNKTADLAVFRVDAKDLTPLALGDDAAVGAAVSIISHPDRRCFFHSSGEVARYSKAPSRSPAKGATWMSVTADFAKGSSGGPVLNADGAVVGMVSSTQSITYGPPAKDGKPTGPHQMVIRNCVPVAAVRAITTGPATDASPP
jgi:S1-C subfamily serine protease